MGFTSVWLPIAIYPSKLTSCLGADCLSFKTNLGWFHLVSIIAPDDDQVKQLITHTHTHTQHTRSEWWLFELVILLAGALPNADVAVAVMGIL